MSIRLMSDIWENSKVKGSKLLMLLAIADYANDNGKAWPAIGTLAKKCRMSERNAQMIVRQLVDDGELTIDENAGPHGCNLYFVVSNGVKPTSPPLKPTSPPLKPTSPGGEIQRQKGVKPTSPDPSLTIKEPESKHPAIQAVREITNRYPPKALYTMLIGVLGDNPDKTRLKTNYEQWCKRGYNPNALTWATDWYKDGGTPAARPGLPNAKDPNFRRRPRPELIRD